MKKGDNRSELRISAPRLVNFRQSDNQHV
ncbi:Protein of unknown function [Bacillus mobilis]|nr:Protein of unknown function [Bacillus mobilis]